MAGLLLHPDAAVPSHTEYASMSVTRSGGRGAVVAAEPVARVQRPVLVVLDIEGAQPTPYRPARRTGGLFYDTADVEGARPRQLHRALSYAPALIEGSAPCATRFHTQRRTDPVAPDYALPAAAAPVPVAMPYKRDTALRNDDIAGSAPSAHLPWETRPHHTGVADIAGTCPRPRTLSWQHEHVDASLDVRDINAYRTFRSQRLTDPQRPTFAVHGRVVADDDAGMFVTRARGPADHPDFSLTTADIDGAECPRQKEFTVGGIKPADRRHFRVTNFVGDIAGTQPGSRKKGLATLRGTDAQERDYVLLDGRTLDAQELTVGKSWYNAAATLISASAGAAAATAPLLARTSLASGVSPYVSYARRVLDPVAAEVARLRGEVHVLRGERDLATLRLQATRELPRAAAHEDEAPHAPEAAATQQQQQLPSAQLGSLLPVSSRLPSAHDGGGVTRGGGGSAAGLTPREPVPVLSGGVGGASWVQRARWGGAADAVVDPIAALRSSAASASVRDLLGVLPATRNDYLSSSSSSSLGGSTLRAASGVYDRTLDAAPAAPRPGPTHAQAAGASAAIRANVAAAQGAAVHARAVARHEERAAAAEVLEVRALPR